MPQIIGVLLPLPFHDPFDYKAKGELHVGDLVRVPFGKEVHVGVVWKLEKSSNLEDKKIKSVIEKINFPPLSKSLIKFINFVAEYNLNLKGLILKMVLSVKPAFEDPKTNIFYTYSGKTLAEAKLKNSDARWRVVNFFNSLPSVEGRVGVGLAKTPSSLYFSKSEICSGAGVADSVLKPLIEAGLLTPVAITQKKEFLKPNAEHYKVTLTEEQKTAANELVGKVASGFSATLLDGITGSGKTEVYFEAVAKALELDKQVLILVPEIALTSQWLGRFERRFGVKPAVWHSNLSQKERVDNYLAIAENRAKVIIGARSALFLPYANLGLIVVDESHDHSFKQEELGNYQARDMAVVRAKFEGFPIILSTATPALETVCNVEEGKYACVKLTSRYASAELPEIKIIDLKKDKPQKYIPNNSLPSVEEEAPFFSLPSVEGRAPLFSLPSTEGRVGVGLANKDPSLPKPSVSWLAPSLVAAIKENLEKQEQSMLFLNRRGYAPLTICRDCGHRIECPHCTAWMTEHRKSNRLICHHCGHTASIPKTCPECGSEEGLTACGPGVERIAEETKARFPNARVEIVSSDITTSFAAVSQIISRMENKEIDILIGTQILAKGHHFPTLTLVGIVDADLGLMGSDLRASEQTFQLLSQVSGRAGRGDKKGTVYLQTLYPENTVLKALVDNDRETFLNLEKKTRKLLKMPPYGKLAAIIVSGLNKDAAEKIAIELGRTSPNTDLITTLGPAPAPIHRLRGKYRYRLLLKTAKNINIQELIKTWLKKINIPNNVRVDIDIDPYSFM